MKPRPRSGADDAHRDHAELPGEFHSLQQVRRITSLSVRTLRRYIRGAVERRLPAFQIGGRKFLVHRDELRAWLEHFQYQGCGVQALVAKIREATPPCGGQR